MGQVITGVILGSVRDESGAVLPGATVTITSPQLPAGPRVVVTNEKGQYRFPNLAPGIYALGATLPPNFGTYSEEGIRVVVGGSVERIVTLKIAAMAETITVTGESPIVDARKSGVSTNYGTEYMENTPLRRFSFFDFTKAAPGMSATNPTSGTSSRVSAFGSNVDENAYLMDGTDFTAPWSGAAWPWPDTDVIEEIEIISLGASAEYGNIMGAVFNVVTKQGTNDFRADAAYFGMSDNLTSKPIVLDCDCPEGETGFTRGRYRDFTIHSGVPIVKDKAWIYGGYQYLRDYDNQPGTDPRFPRKFEADRIYWKFTWQINENIKFMNTYHDDYWVIPQTPSVASPFDTILTFSGHNPSVTFGNITHVLNDNTFYDVRVSGFYPPSDTGEPNGNFGVSGSHRTARWSSWWTS
ncbi:MAG: carboxypeptidase regulatory-like domain-containing protein [Acidobacteriota bacterium]